MSRELRATHTSVWAREHVWEGCSWVVLGVSALGLSAFLWNHGRFDLDIYLDAGELLLEEADDAIRQCLLCHRIIPWFTTS